LEIPGPHLWQESGICHVMWVGIRAGNGRSSRSIPGKIHLPARKKAGRQAGPPKARNLNGVRHGRETSTAIGFTDQQGGARMPGREGGQTRTPCAGPQGKTGRRGLLSQGVRRGRGLKKQGMFGGLRRLFFRQEMNTAKRGRFNPGRRNRHASRWGPKPLGSGAASGGPGDSKACGDGIWGIYFFFFPKPTTTGPVSFG